MSTLPDGTTLYESDHPLQVLNPTEGDMGIGGLVGAMTGHLGRLDSIEEILTAEVQKHLPKGYIGRANREEAFCGWAVRIWWEKPGVACHGPEAVVALARLGLEEIRSLSATDPNRWRLRLTDPNRWRLRLVRVLQEDFDARRAAGTLPNQA